MKIDVFSIFPEYVSGPLGLSLIGKAQQNTELQVRTHNIRDWATDRHRSVDDEPYGGGPGMVMRPEPIFAAVRQVQPPRPVFLLSAGGKLFDQAQAVDLAKADGFSLICGRYEGVDQRVADELCDGELSIGNYVLSGGEAAALVIIEAVARLLPGVMGNLESGDEESFSGWDLEYPQYTRPAEFEGYSVPQVLSSGNHQKILQWRKDQSRRRTLQNRPELQD